MKRLPTQVFLLIMFFTAASYAQKRQGYSMQWKIAARLPATSGQLKALGFAGLVAGVHQNVLIGAGGANFPACMPWPGGKKKYYDSFYLFGKKGEKSELI